jgi:hypothetical protein
MNRKGVLCIFLGLTEPYLALKTEKSNFCIFFEQIVMATVWTQHIVVNLQ